jgi:hypothetical protein
LGHVLNLGKDGAAVEQNNYCGELNEKNTPK